MYGLQRLCYRLKSAAAALRVVDDSQMDFYDNSYTSESSVLPTGDMWFHIVIEGDPLKTKKFWHILTAYKI